MNKIYKVIWNKVKGCYVVSSELAKNRTKSGRRTRNLIVGALALAIGLNLTCGTAFASKDGNIQWGSNFSHTDNMRGSTIIGDNITITSPSTRNIYNVLLGNDIKAEYQWGTALGYHTYVGICHGVALGASSVADRRGNDDGCADTLSNQGSDFTNYKEYFYKSNNYNDLGVVRGAVSVGSDDASGSKNGGVGQFTRQIINVAPGVKDTDAVNLLQVKNAHADAIDVSNQYTDNKLGAYSSELSYQADTGNGSLKLKKDVLTVQGDNNITTKAAANGKITVNLNKMLDLGNARLDGKSGRLALGDAADKEKVILDGEHGIIAAGTARLLHDGTITNGKVYLGKDGLIANENVSIENDGTINNDKIRLGSDGMITNDKVRLSNDGTIANDKVYLANDGMIANDKVQLNNDGTAKFGKVTINAKGQIDKLSDGAVSETSEQAVNGSQLWKATQGLQNDLDGASLAYSDGREGGKLNLKKDVLTIKGDKNITTAADANGTIAVKLNQDINLDKLRLDGQNGYVSIGAADNPSKIMLDGRSGNITNGKVHLQGDGLISNGKVALEKDGLISNEKVSITNDGVITNGKATIKQDGSFFNSNVRMDNNGLSVLSGGMRVYQGGFTINANNRVDFSNNVLHNVGAAVTDTDAVNYGQMKSYVGDELNKLNLHIGTGSATAANGGTSGGVSAGTTNEAAVNLQKGKLQVNGDKNINIDVVQGENQKDASINVNLNKDVAVDSVTTGKTVINAGGVSVDGKTYVSSTGLDANSHKITNVANGEKPTDAVNLAQLEGYNKHIFADDEDFAVTTDDHYLNDHKHLGFRGDGNIVTSFKVDKDNDAHEIHTHLSNKLNMNNTVFIDSEKGFMGIDGDNDKKVDSKNDVFLAKDGVHAGSKKVHDVADGEVSTVSKEAVNGSQLFALGTATNQNFQAIGHEFDNVYHRIGQLDSDISNVGALSSAMAALHPMGYDPAQPTQIMAGIGAYRGKQAIALGVAHYSSDRSLVTGGVSYAPDGRFMMNLGMTWKFGKKGQMPITATSSQDLVAIQNEMAALKANNEALAKDNQQMRAELNMLMKKMGIK